MGMWSGLLAFGGGAGVWKVPKRSEEPKNDVKSEENRVAATQYEIVAISELVEWLSDYALADDFKEKHIFVGNNTSAATRNARNVKTGAFSYQKVTF